jgi:hypothetical protein
MNWVCFNDYLQFFMCAVVKTIVFESISRSGLPTNSKFSEGRMFSSCYSFRKRLFRLRVWYFNAFPFPRTRTSLCASYFLLSTLKLWNYLPPEIKDWPSLSILKYILTSRVDHDKIPKYYYYGPRLTQILHARLLPTNSKFSEGRMFSSCYSFRKRLFRLRVYFGH